MGSCIQASTESTRESTCGISRLPPCKWLYVKNFPYYTHALHIRMVYRWALACNQYHSIYWLLNTRTPPVFSTQHPHQRCIHCSRLLMCNCSMSSINDTQKTSFFNRCLGSAQHAKMGGKLHWALM